MTEKQIKFEACKVLDAGHFIYWFPPWTISKGKFYRNDIFNVFDVVAIKKNRVVFIQFTTLSNLSHRRKKIQDFVERVANARGGFPRHGAEIWAWDKKKLSFKVEEVIMQ